LPTEVTLDRSLQGMTLTRSLSIPAFRSFQFTHTHTHAHIPWTGDKLAHYILHEQLTSLLQAYRPLQHCNKSHNPVWTYWKSAAFVVSSAQRYSICQTNSW